MTRTARRTGLLGLGLLTLAPLVSAVPTAQAAVACSVSYAVQSAWSNGFQGAITIRNTGDALTSWTLTFSFPGGQTVSQGWNGVWTTGSPAVTVKNEAWNGTLAAGGTVSPGFIGTGTATTSTPASFALNGVTCGSGTATTTTTTRPVTTTTTTRPATTTTTTTTRPVTTTTTTTRTTTTTTTTTTTNGTGTGVLAQVHTPGRVADNGTSVQYTWPGTYFEGRFHGTGVGLVLNDSTNDYDVMIDGAAYATVRAPGNTTYQVTGLSNADHTVRLAKRTENPWGVANFGGLVPASGGSILSKPAARSRQIEFVGDSFTAGYGNRSTSHECSATGGVNANSDADQAFGALAARGLNADYQLIAWSGLGMVRNYGGQSTDVSLRAYYDQTLGPLYNSTVWNTSGWRPQVVVVGLGINDFSTALNSNEKWSSIAALTADYKTAYQGFIDKLRSRYGSGTWIVVSTTSYGSANFVSAATGVVSDRRAAGDNRIALWDYSNAALDFNGCDWHPSAHDEGVLSSTLTTFLAGLPVAW